jgi:hypothetical protein
MIWVAIILGVIVMATFGGWAEKDAVNLNYDTVVVYNSDMTKVLYSNTDGCTIKDEDGTIMIVIRKDGE